MLVGASEGELSKPLVSSVHPHLQQKKRPGDEARDGQSGKHEPESRKSLGELPVREFKDDHDQKRGDREATDRTDSDQPEEVVMEEEVLEFFDDLDTRGPVVCPSEFLKFDLAARKPIEHGIIVRIECHVGLRGFGRRGFLRSLPGRDVLLIVLGMGHGRERP